MSDTFKPPVEELTLRDKLAAACLPAIYAAHSMFTDCAADLAYEQADEMLRARQPQNGER